MRDAGGTRGVPAASCSGEKPMHRSFQSCACSSALAFGLLLMCGLSLLAQNMRAPVESNKDLPDAPMPVTTASPTQNNRSFTRGALPPSFDADRVQAEWMRKSSAIGYDRPPFNTNALASEGSRAYRKDMKAAGGRSLANRITFDPIGEHANRTATHAGNQWYTTHIPWAGSIMKRGIKISRAHPHLTTVIKTLKPRL